MQIKSALRKQSNDRTTPKVFVFLAAAPLPSIDICANCIKNGGSTSWSEVLKDVNEDFDEEVGIERDCRGMSSMEPMGWSEKVMMRVPAKALSGLFKAISETKAAGSDMEPDWAQVSRLFLGAC